MKRYTTINSVLDSDLEDKFKVDIIASLVVTSPRLGTFDFETQAIVKVADIEDVKHEITNLGYMQPHEETIKDIFNSCVKDWGSLPEDEYITLVRNVMLYEDELMPIEE